MQNILILENRKLRVRVCARAFKVVCVRVYSLIISFQKTEKILILNIWAFLWTL